MNPFHEDYELIGNRNLVFFMLVISIVYFYYHMLEIDKLIN